MFNDIYSNHLFQKKNIEPNLDFIPNQPSDKKTHSIHNQTIRNIYNNITKYDKSSNYNPSHNAPQQIPIQQKPIQQIPIQQKPMHCNNKIQSVQLKQNNLYSFESPKNNLDAYHFSSGGTKIEKKSISEYINQKNDKDPCELEQDVQSMQSDAQSTLTIEKEHMGNQPCANKAQLLEFRKHIYSWLDHDDKIRQHRNDIKKINQNKKKLTETIIHFMEKYEVKDLTTSNGDLKYSVRNKKKLNKETLLKALSAYFQDEEKGIDATKYVMDNIPTAYIPYIKRTKKKNNKTPTKIKRPFELINHISSDKKDNSDTHSMISKSKRTSLKDNSDTHSMISKSKRTSLKDNSDTHSMISKSSYVSNLSKNSSKLKPNKNIHSKHKIIKKKIRLTKKN